MSPLSGSHCFVPEVGVHCGLTSSPLLSRLFPFGATLTLLLLSTPESSFSLPENCYSQTSRTSPMMSLRSWLYPCSQDDSQKSWTKRGTDISTGSFLFRQTKVAQMDQSVFSLFDSQNFLLPKLYEFDFSKEFIFLIFKLLFKF